MLVMLPLYYEGHTKRVRSVFYIMEAKKSDGNVQPDTRSRVPVHGADISTFNQIKSVFRFLFKTCGLDLVF